MTRVSTRPAGLGEDTIDLRRDAFCGFRERQRTFDHVADQLTAPISADALSAHRFKSALGKSPEFRLRTLGGLRGVAQLIEIRTCHGIPRPLPGSSKIAIRSCLTLLRSPSRTVMPARSKNSRI